MEYVKKLKVIKENNEKEFIYFVEENNESEFLEKTYTVGIICGKERREVKDFSPLREESIRFCEYLYAENVSLNHLFLVGEEFITEMNI